VQNSLFVKKNSLLLSLVLAIGMGSSADLNAMAAPVVRAPRSFLHKSLLITGIAAVLRAATKDAEKAPFSVYDASSVINDVKELIAAKQYKVAAFMVAKFVDDAIVGFVRKNAGISVASSSLAIKGEDVPAGSLIKDATEYHLLKKEGTPEYGVVGTFWTKFKGFLEAMEGITKAQKTVEEFGKLVA
jgi:hypothetical protein